MGLSISGETHAEEEIPKPGLPTLPLPPAGIGQSRLWSSGVSLGSLPSAQLIPALSEKQEAEEGWRGRWQDPDQIPRTLPAFVAMVMLLFLSRSRCSKPSLSLFQRGQPGSALTLQCSIFSPRKSSDGRKGHPWVAPPPGDCLAGLPCTLEPFGFQFQCSVLCFQDLTPPVSLRRCSRRGLHLRRHRCCPGKPDVVLKNILFAPPLSP